MYQVWSWSNPNYIYVSTFPSWWGEKKMYKSTDGGNTFTDITPSSTVMPDRRWIPFDIEVNAEDPEKIYIGRTSMYGDGAYEWGVYTSDDGGTTWSNITGSLNGEAITNIKHQQQQRITDGVSYFVLLTKNALLPSTSTSKFSSFLILLLGTICYKKNVRCKKSRSKRNK